MGIKISTFPMTANMESEPPTASDPVSPIKALAGWINIVQEQSQQTADHNEREHLNLLLVRDE